MAVRDARIVGQAAALMLVISVPPAVAVGALRQDDLGADSNLWHVAAFLALVVGPAAAGAMVGRRRPDAPLLHAAAATGLAWALLGIVSVLRAILGPADVATVAATLCTVAPIQVGVGVLGALCSRPQTRAEETPS